MASLYEINNRLVNIFNEIESNEGEVNDELYDALVITKEELYNKLDSYVKAIKSWSADADAIKTEKSKLNARQNVYKNRVERLKKAICIAVNNFGTVGKTNKYIELVNYKISTRNTISANVDVERISDLCKALTEFLHELNSNGCLYVGEDFDINGVLNAINNAIIAEKGAEYEPFTIDDFEYITINVDTTIPIKDVFTNNSNLATLIADGKVNIEPCDDKNHYKDVIATENCGDLTVANLVNNQTITIR
nr:MAG TPA: resistance protein [Crassvirales sp.]